MKSCLKTVLLAIVLAAWIGVASAKELRGSFDEDVLDVVQHRELLLKRKRSKKVLKRANVGDSCNLLSVCKGEKVRCKGGKCKRVECTKNKHCGSGEKCSKNKCKERKICIPGIPSTCDKGEYCDVLKGCQKRGKTGEKCIPAVQPCDKKNFCIPGAGVCAPREVKSCLPKIWKDVKGKNPKLVNDMKMKLLNKFEVPDANDFKDVISNLELKDKLDVENLANLFCDDGEAEGKEGGDLMKYLESDFLKCMMAKIPKSVSADNPSDEEGKKEAEAIINLPMVFSIGVSAAGGKLSAGVIKDLDGGEKGCYASACTGANIDGKDVDLELGIYFAKTIEEASGAFLDFGEGNPKKGPIGIEFGIGVPGNKLNMEVRKGKYGVRGSKPEQEEGACFSYVNSLGGKSSDDEPEPALEPAPLVFMAGVQPAEPAAAPLGGGPTDVEPAALPLGGIGMQPAPLSGDAEPAAAPLGGGPTDVEPAALPGMQPAPLGGGAEPAAAPLSA